MTSHDETDLPYAAAEENLQQIERGTELDDEISDFWEVARVKAGLGKIAVVGGLTVTAGIPPVAWAFGEDPAVADELLALVLAGTKTGTSSALSDFDADDVSLPVVGELAIILDGQGHPAALIRTTQVEIVAFDDVDAGFAAAEGEGDQPVESWRTEHTTRFLGALGVDELPEGFQIVTERFELLFPVR